MSPIRPILSRSCLMLALAFALAACGSATPTKPNTPSLEQRMLEHEGRVEKLEARPEVKPPFRSKAEIQANIQALYLTVGKQSYEAMKFGTVGHVAIFAEPAPPTNAYGGWVRLAYSPAPKKRPWTG